MARNRKVRKLRKQAAPRANHHIAGCNSDELKSTTSAPPKRVRPETSPETEKRKPDTKCARTFAEAPRDSTPEPPAPEEPNEDLPVTPPGEPDSDYVDE